MEHFRNIPHLIIILIIINHLFLINCLINKKSGFNKRQRVLNFQKIYAYSISIRKKKFHKNWSILKKNRKEEIYDCDCDCDYDYIVNCLLQNFLFSFPKKQKKGIIDNKLFYKNWKEKKDSEKEKYIIDNYIKDTEKIREIEKQKKEILVDILVEKKLNECITKSLSEKRFENIFQNQKGYSFTKSKNPPYVFHPIYSNVHIKRTHRFKIKKYENVFTYLQNSGLYEPNYFIPFCEIKEILKYMYMCHTTDYINAMLKLIEQKENKTCSLFELDISPELLCRYITEISGTILSSLLSVKYFVSLHIGGGNHHAKKNRGDGFCIFNDIAIATHFLLFHKIVKNVIILDVDVHQGDGTAEIFENCSIVKTISLHCKKNYPKVKKNSFIDIEFEPYIKDEEYLSVYKQVLKNIEKNYLNKDSIIFYLAGVDVSEEDDLGLLMITDKGIYERDFLTFQMALRNKIPIVSVLSGGYIECEKILTQKHVLTFRAAKDAWNLYLSKV